MRGVFLAAAEAFAAVATQAADTLKGDPDAGQQKAVMCSACHGMDGKGNKIFGAPNLTDDIWLYGGSNAAIRETIVRGRNGMMPAHGDLLGENRTKILAAYVVSLSQN